MSIIPYCLLAFFTRAIIANLFWKAGRTKLEGFLVTDQTMYLFEKEYHLPIFEAKFAAYFTAYSEHLFPALLIIGLASRLSALALLILTAVIQIFIYPGAWGTHGLWAIGLLVIIKYGPGKISLDYLLSRHFRSQGYI